MEAFRGWPKISRWNRTIRITEKIDGSNAAVCISTDVPPDWEHIADLSDFLCTAVVTGDEVHYVWAQSRTRVVTPSQDNYGFAEWVWNNAEELVHHLGEGRWFGEWAGFKIQAAYPSATEREFWLFPHDHAIEEAYQLSAPFRHVPILYEGPMSEVVINECLDYIALNSDAYPGQPGEGIIIEHLAGGHKYKITVKGDEQPKSFVL